MSDPIVRLAEQAAERDREIAELSGRVDAHADQLRGTQADTIDRAGLPADLVAVESNVWKRYSPARNRWPEVAEFDERVAELEMRQAQKAAELRELRDQEIAAPAADHNRLATWQLDGEQGSRPEPELPRIREQIQLRQQEWEALTVATTRVLAERAAYVEKHRGRLVKEADSHADEAHRRYLELIDEVAHARTELFAARRTALWARLYPGEQATREVADTFAGGQPKHLRPMGLTAQVAPDRVFEAFKADADWLRQAATPEQKAAIGEGRDPKKPPATVWDRSEEGQQWQRDERERALERLRNPQ